MMIVGDTHDLPSHSQERFEWALEVADHYLDKGDWIVQVGDFGDWVSFSSFDKGTKGHVEENYEADFVSADAAWRKFYNPRYRYCVVEGNHEYRIQKAIKEDYRLDGLLSMNRLPWRRNHRVVQAPYGQKVCINGVHFVHHLTSRTGRAVSGSAQSQFRKFRGSLVVGHSHVWDWFEEAIDHDNRQFCMIAGHLSHPDHAKEEWCRATSHDWWSGVTLLFDVKDGFPHGGIVREPYRP